MFIFPQIVLNNACACVHLLTKRLRAIGKKNDPEWAIENPFELVNAELLCNAKNKKNINENEKYKRTDYIMRMMLFLIFILFFFSYLLRLTIKKTYIKIKLSWFCSEIHIKFHHRDILPVCIQKNCFLFLFSWFVSAMLPVGEMMGI